MGVGIAMLEKTIYDKRNGWVLNSKLADYVMAAHADSPELEVIFLDHPDTWFNSTGTRGIGEIGLAGIAAAITNAVHHATGVHVGELPVKVEDLLRGCEKIGRPAFASPAQRGKDWHGASILNSEFFHSL